MSASYPAATDGQGVHELPTIAYFLGIAVRMFFNDHDPPHFHVRYQGFRARSYIRRRSGRRPLAADSHATCEWTALRREPLMRNWRAARSDGQLERIGGLE